MNITAFNKDYLVRRFGDKTEYKGYIMPASTSDFVLNANVHPSGSQAMRGLPEGERGMLHLEGHGNAKLFVANLIGADKHAYGDMLLYHGRWYECTSCVYWEHTVLSHYNYMFTEVPEDISSSTDLTIPTSVPKGSEA